MMVLATLMRFLKLWFPQFWNCILPLRGGLGGANASFTSFLRAEEKEKYFWFLFLGHASARALLACYRFLCFNPNIFS